MMVIMNDREDVLIVAINEPHVGLLGSEDGDIVVPAALKLSALAK